MSDRRPDRAADNQPVPRHFAIIPAAGHSRRMGAPKLLLPWRGLTVIDAVLHAWVDAGVDQIVLVIRKDDTALAHQCERFMSRNSQREVQFDIVRPVDDPEDMRASVQHGLNQIALHHHPSDCDTWLLAPADMPTLSSSVIRQIIAMRASDTRTITVPIDGTGKGHPALFPWPLANDVLQLAAGVGINTLVERLPQHRVVVSGELSDDIDTQDDYLRLLHE